MKEIGSFFKENFEGVENTPPSHVWENISKDTALKKYNRTQWLKKGAWYGATVVSVITLVTVAFYGMNKNQENRPVPQKETVAITEIIQEDRDIPIFENADASRDLSQNVSLPTTYTSNEVTFPVSHTPATHTSAKPASKTEDAKITEKEPVKISVLQAKKSLESPSIHNVSLPNIPIEKRGTDIEEFVEEDAPDSDIFAEEETTNSLVTIPRAFTPNNDGLNDLFIVYSSEKIFDYKISIYEQSGRLVYTSIQIEKGWDGNYRGEAAPQGIYVYIITFTSAEKEKIIKQGPLLLIR